MKKIALVLALIMFICFSAQAELEDINPQDIDISGLSVPELNKLIGNLDLFTNKLNMLKYKAMYLIFSKEIHPDASCKEISFRNIPWGTTSDDAMKLLIADGIAAPKEEIDRNDYIYSWRMDFDDPGDALMGNAGDAISIYSFDEDFQIAGHKVESMRLFFPYSIEDGEINYNKTSFINVEIDFDFADADAVKYDLLTKLESIYGKSVENKENYYQFSTGGNYDVYRTWNVWYGKNNTGICLYHKYWIMNGTNERKYDELVLMYAKTDGMNHLKLIESLRNDEKKNEERLRIENQKNNTDGL